jgi:uncharacterized OB-fold protein
MSDRYDPASNPETRRFWEAAAEGEYLLKTCRGCGETHYYPRALCPFCLSAETEWTPSKGQGEIYSYSSTRRDGTLHIIAYVTLDEGPTVLTNIVGSEADRIRIGARVKLKFQAGPDGRALPMFELA